MVQGTGPGATAAIVLGVLGTAGVLSFALYKWRLKKYMDAEIRSILSDYMPLTKELQDLSEPMHPRGGSTATITSAGGGGATLLATSSSLTAPGGGAAAGGKKQHGGLLLHPDEML